MTSRRVERAVAKERTSKTYAEGYYNEEDDIASLFDFDTSVLESFITKKGSLFDAMMGPGRHVLHFSSKGFPVEGNDYNAHMVSQVSEGLKKKKLKAKLHNLDVTDLSSIKDKRFSYVICMANSLGCVPGSQNRQKGLNEFARVLKSGGTLMFHAFNRLSFLFNEDDRHWVFKTYFAREKDLELGDYIYYHGKELGMTYNHIFSLPETKNLIKNAGLIIKDIKFLNRAGNGYCKGPAKFVRAGSFIVVAQKP